MRDKITKILSKVTLAKNKARKDFISSFLLGLLNSRKVQFKEVALHIESDAKLASVERQIQGFFADFEFDYRQVCMLLCLFLPKGKLSLSIDRIEWDFGKYQCNILMIVARNGSTGIPLYWSLLDNKSGNSNAQNRIDLLEKLLEVIDKKRIALIVGDREFIGIKWVKYLKKNQIPFCMRLPKHHFVTLKNGEVYTISELLSRSEERYFQDCLVDGIKSNVMMKRLKDDEFLFLMGSFPAKKLGKLYRKRWCIEVLFQQFKDRGFDLESTHLKYSKKLSKLLVFVSIAVALAMNVGEFYHRKVQKIKRKKHGYFANSFFRKGLDLIRRGLKNRSEKFSRVWQRVADVFVKYLDFQMEKLNMTLIQTE